MLMHALLFMVVLRVSNFPDEAHAITWSPPLLRTPLSGQANLAVIVVQATQDWQGEDLAFLLIERNRLTRPFWNLLPDSLMQPGLVEVLDIGTQDTMQLLLLQDEHVI